MELISKIKRYNISSITFYITLLFIFVFFYRISSLTPLAGDDWGYAVNGLQGHPFKMAFEFYFSWSGRFFSELYGFLITPHKEIWNVLNALLFASIFYNALKISKTNRSISSMLLLIFLMLSVKDELRMETYTWLMGTTYVIPLALSLFFLNKIITVIENGLKLKKIYISILAITLFYIGLTMENIALVMIFAIILLIIYCYFKYKYIPTYLYIFLLSSIIGFILLRLSPGANARLIRDHKDWLSFSLIKQITINYPNFIRLTFIEHRYLVLIFSSLNIILILNNIYQKRKLSLLNLVLLTIFIFGSFISISLTASTYYVSTFILKLTDYKSLVNLIFWPTYIVSIFINTQLLKKEDQYKVLFFILLAGLSNGVMMASPIFGYRSSLYTVYFMIISCLIYFKSIDSKYLSTIIIIPILLLILRSSTGLLQKYQLVDNVHEIRMGEITYYQKNPNIKEAWLIRYPIFTIHSGDIEQDDTYHMDVFKQYFGLQNDLKIYFYYPDNGYDHLYD